MMSFYCFVVLSALLCLFFVALPNCSASNGSIRDWATSIDEESGRRVCLDNADRRNTRDVYPNPLDCHSYYRCYFANASFAVGLRHDCPPKHFWSADVLHCLPEGRLPCVDQCRNGSIAELGCYAATRNCAKYFKCSAFSSQPMCCPRDTRFNPNTCRCVFDVQGSCHDKCSTAQSATPSAIHHPRFVDEAPHNSSHCQDQFGNVLEAFNGRPEMFAVVKVASSLEQSPRQHFTATCDRGSIFDLKICRCRPAVDKRGGDTDDLMADDADDDNHDDPAQSLKLNRNRQCALYLPLDDDADDKSANSFVTYAHGEVELSGAISARGRGSLRFDGGRLEIPHFTRTVDLRDEASWCLFFRSESKDQSGGLLSNRVYGSSVDYSVAIGAWPSNRVVARLNFEHPVFEASVNNSAPIDDHPDAFTQLCLVYDGFYVTTFVDNVLLAKVPAAGFVHSSSSPYSLGTDGIYGDFHGFIDEVLVCPHALTGADVNAHWKGQDALVQAGLIPPQA